jgi:hypothetical protein
MQALVLTDNSDEAQLSTPFSSEIAILRFWVREIALPTLL